MNKLVFALIIAGLLGLLVLSGCVAEKTDYQFCMSSCFNSTCKANCEKLSENYQEETPDSQIEKCQDWIENEKQEIETAELAHPDYTFYIYSEQVSLDYGEPECSFFSVVSPNNKASYDKNEHERLREVYEGRHRMRGFE